MTNKAGKSVPVTLFGTSGIRGRLDEFLTPEFAKKVSLSFAAFLENNGTVLVARDVRSQSELIQKAVISGLSDGGINVLNCGVATTPATLVALKKLRHKAAVMVTGSHVPAPATGLLFFLDDTGEMDRQGEERVEAYFRSTESSRVLGNERGAIRAFDVLTMYIEEMRKQLGRISGYRIVVDPGNGAACLSLGQVLENLGCEVITINGNLDGTFPSRSPYPEPSNLSQLALIVKEAKADLGVGTDSDGDRALFATEHGQVLWGDITSALFAKNELKVRGGGRIITTVNTSSVIQLLCQEYGGNLTVTKVGPPAIAEALRSHSDVIFATEESGKHIWPTVIFYGDAAYATAKLLQILKQEQKGLEELQNELPKFHQFKSTIPCPEQLKTRVFELVLETWENTGKGQVSRIDGLKVTYPDLSWFLARASGTEPIFRCQSESRDSSEARKLLDLATELVRSAITRAGKEP